MERMTHDELTIRIIKLSEDNNENWKFYPALRKVVELHKPKATIRGYRCKFDDEKFPCTHHQTIEKELG